MTNSENLEQALIDFGLALMLDEDPALAASEPDENVLIKKALDWFAARKEQLRSVLCDDGHPRKAVLVGTNLAVATLLKMSGQFTDHFPVQAAANAITTFGLERFCKGEIPG